MPATPRTPCACLTRRRAFALTAIATLALGLGAPTTIFSIVRAVLLRPLPYPDADRIVRFRIESRTPRGQQIAFDALPATAALEWASTSTSLASIALYNDTARTLTTPGGPVRLTGLSATPNLFDVLGTAPLVGHTFGAGDRDVRQIVLSHATWQQHFHGAPSAIGSLVTLDGQAHRIVGVMPAEFEFPSRETRFWLPVVLSTGSGRGMLLSAIARMTPDANIASVTAEGRRVLKAQGGEQQNLIVRTLRDQMVGSVRRLLWVLMAAVSLVSAIAVVNLALLLLTQGASRSAELAVRLALGGSRARLIRQVAVEGLVLATAGGVAGLVFAVLFLQALVRIAPPDVPRLHQTSFDAQVLAFGVALVLVASVLFAIVSAGSVVAGDALRSLMGSASESRLLSTAASRRRLNGLAAAELALAVVLLVGAGLLLRSFVRLVLVDHGFEARGALAAQVTLPSARYPTPASRMDFHERLLGRLRQLRGAEHAGLITSMPNRQPTGRFAYDPVGVAMFPEPFTMQVAEVRMATEGFVEAMGIPLLSGRSFGAGDVEGAEPVMVISEELARHHFPDTTAVGRMLYSGSGNCRVVGVVGTVKSAVAAGAQHNPSAYLPLRQNLNVFQQFATMSIVVRGRDHASTRARPAGDRALARPGPGDVQRPHAGGRGQRPGRGPALQRHGAGALCPRRRADGGHRRLRRDGLRRGSAHARDWRPHRARRDASPDLQAHRPGRRGGDRGWTLGRFDRRHLAGTDPHGPAPRDRARGSDCAGLRRRGALDCWRCGDLSARPPRHPHERAPRPARGLTVNCHLEV